MKNERFRFENIDVLEWYDGIIRGLGSSQGKQYLITLAAWEIDKNKKLYLMLDLDESSKKKIVAAVAGEGPKETNWQAFTSIFDKFIEGYSGNVNVIQGDLVINQEYVGHNVDASFLTKIIPYDVQNAIQSDSVTFWFNLE